MARKQGKQEKNRNRTERDGMGNKTERAGNMAFLTPTVSVLHEYTCRMDSLEVAQTKEEHWIGALLVVVLWGGRYVVVVGTVAHEGGGEGGHCMAQEPEDPYKALGNTSEPSRQRKQTMQYFKCE